MTVRFHYELSSAAVLWWNDHNRRGQSTDGDSDFQDGNLLVAETAAAAKPFYRLCPGGQLHSRSKPFQIDVMGAKILTTVSAGIFLLRAVEKVFNGVFKGIFNRGLIYSELLDPFYKDP